MTVATYSPSAAQAHYGSPTIRPMQRQSANLVTPVRSPLQPQSQLQAKQMTQPAKGSRPWQHIWVVTGPAGCGKTTVGKELARYLGVPYVEGDDHHPPSNKAKMTRGEPLTDADRWDWLIALRDHAISVLSATPSTNPSTTTDPTTFLPPPAANLPTPPSAVVVTCSALKFKYRDEFRVAPHSVHAHGLRIRVRFLYLAISEALSLKRVAERQGHFMPAELVKSQFASLEEPNEAELDQDVVSVTVDRKKPEEVMADVVRGVQGSQEREEDEDFSWETRCAA